jgi:4-hydroxythreonine-4-phosphate dehydrogenase
MSQTKPRIAVTMGDPAGVGPEICLRLLAEEAIAEMWTPIVFGDADILHRVAEATNLAPPDRIIGRADWSHLHAEVDAPTVLDLRPPGASQIEPATVSVDAGRAAWTFIKAAIDSALAGEVDAVTTAPINKLSLSRAGVPFPGHTEIFAHHTNAERHCMMQYSDEVTASFVTCHVGLRDVPDLITEERVFETIELTSEALKLVPERPSKIVVCGLNPHAGEGGLFGGQEEETAIVPAIERALSSGIDVEGPLPPDTTFLPARRKTTGCTVCMYHDQGHIPLKALAFDRAVNITLGLPIVRTSVDHGTAFDIAWEGIADPGSLFEAVRLAARFGANRSAGAPV